jgi:tetratricopeptide (TPR) repeat protein
MASETNHQDHQAQTFLRDAPHLSDHGATASQSPRDTYPASAPPPETQWMPSVPPPQEILAHIEEWPSFFALAIRIDGLDASVPPESLHLTLTDFLRNAENDRQVRWFHWQGPLYASLLPVTDGAPAEDFAHQIQEHLIQTCDQTVTIGIAPYPLITYTPSQTLTNACKAVDHAAFFGPRSCTRFDAVSLNISGDHYYQAGDLRTAIAEYEDALKLDPSDVNVLNSLGVCQANQENFAAARECFEKAATLIPGETMAIYNLGVIQLLEENTAEALITFQKAFAMDDKTFEIPFQIGKIMVEKEDMRSARPYLERAVELCPENPRALSLLGQCLDDANHMPEAIKMLKKAVKLNPNDAAALSTLGRLYDQKGENPEISLTFSRQSVALAPGNGLYRFRLAQLCQKNGHIDEALREFEQAAELGYDCLKEIDDLRSSLETSRDKESRCA